MRTDDKTILVTGATGHQGSATVSHLLASNWKVRALTRNPNKSSAKILKTMGADLVVGDLSEPDTLREHVKDVYGIFCVLQPVEHGVDEEVRQGKILIDLAKEANIGHFVYSSIGSADKKSGIPFFESKAEIEKYLRNTKNMYWSIIRPVYFMENFLNITYQDALNKGIFSLALQPMVPLQMIAVDDIGAFASMIFENPQEWHGAAIDLAGDELTGPEIAREFSSFLGHTIEFKEEPIDDLYGQGMNFEMMFDWFNRRGFNADIEYARKLYPELKSFYQWLAASNYFKKVA